MPYTVEQILGAAPYVVHERSGYAIWFTEPLGIVSELGHVKHINVEMARFFLERSDMYFTVTGQLDKQRVGVHDWSTMTGYDSDAKAVFVEYVQSRKKLITHSSVILPLHNALARIGVRTAATVLSLLGQPLHFPDNAAQAIKELGLKAAR